MKGVLFPTDFSQNAENALQFAIEIAQKFNAQLHVVHAFQMPYATSAPMTGRLTDTLKEVAEKDLMDYKNKIISNHKNLDIITKALVGDVINVVDDYSQIDDIDLIVMGTKGASGVKEVLIGSNAEEVVKHADKPVLIVPEKATQFSINKIAFASDFEDINLSEVFDVYIQFCQKFDAETYIINIEKEEDKFYSSKKSYEAKRLDVILSDVKHNFNFEVNENVLEGINSFVKQNKCDMLAVLSRKHNFLKRFFIKVLPMH